MKTTLIIEILQETDDGVLTFSDEILQETGWKDLSISGLIRRFYMLEWIDCKDGSFELRKTFV